MEMETHFWCERRSESDQKNKQHTRLNSLSRDNDDNDNADNKGGKPFNHSTFPSHTSDTVVT
jgi:hypothetical protein